MLLTLQFQPVDNPAVRSLTSDDRNKLSISSRSVQHGGAASPFKPR